MTTSQAAAQALVRTYLDGRSMDAFMFAAAVWMAHQRLTRGLAPVLDERLCDDIDSQAQGVRGIRSAPRLASSFDRSHSDDTTQPARLHASR